MSGESPHKGAKVSVLRVPRRRPIRERVREIAALYPGWEVWHSSWSDVWNAHRTDPGSNL